MQAGLLPAFSFGRSRLLTRIYSCDMEPGEKFIRRLLKFVFIILAFILAIVFGEVSFGMGWFGAVIFMIGALMGAVAVHLLKDLRN